MEPGKVIFKPAEVISGNATQEERQALIAAICHSWERYLHLDAAGYAACLGADVTRMSPRAGEVQQGRDVVAAAMVKEWEAFERPEGKIAEQMTLRQAELWVDRHPATVATALYWVEIEGGARWDYDDQGLVFQTFSMVNGAWKITHHLDCWSLNYDLARRQPNTEKPLAFDYVYPVKDLARAVKFYTPLLGQPEAVTKQQASFHLLGPRFVLDTNTLNGHVQVRPKLPSGYARFYVDGLDAEAQRLRSKGVKFLGGVPTVKSVGPDRLVGGFDPAGNLWALIEPNFLSTATGTPAAPTGFGGDSPSLQAAQKLAHAWLRMDGPSLATAHRDQGRWFDDTRINTRGLEKGAALQGALESSYWAHYDRTPQGLLAQMAVSGVRVRQVGPRTLVSYERRLTGVGAHPFQERAFVSQLFDSPSEVVYTLIVANNQPREIVLSLDYTGYPVTDLAAAERFYTNTMDFGQPYDDEDYYGYWADQTVFGIYLADPDEDGIPRPQQANGYISFWVRSAEETHRYLKQQGASFPVIPAINDKSGLDRQPGYIQVVSTDSEGNLVIFTEYTGRRR